MASKIDHASTPGAGGLFPNSPYLTEVLKNTPDRMKHGSPMIDEGDLQLYVGTFLASLLFFAVVYQVQKMLFETFQGEKFTKLDNDAKIWKLLCTVTLVHHFINISFFTYTFYYSCGNIDGYPWPTEQGGTYTSIGSDKRWGWFKDEACILQPNKGFALAKMINLGYSGLDFICLTFFVQERTRIVNQTIAHHYFLFIGFTTAMYAGYWCDGLSTCLLFSEVSSIFLNYNELLSDFSGHAIYLLNQLAFFLTFTVFRMILFPCMAWYCLKYTYIMFNHVELLRGICMGVASCQLVALSILNAIWYRVIVRKIMESLGLGGKPAAEQSKDCQSKDKQVKQD